MKKNKKRNIIMLLLILLLGITVGFAALATTLKINGNASITKNNWSVYWDEDSIAVTQGSKGATIPEVENGEDGSVNTKVTWSVNLEIPGNFYEFTIDAANAGTIDAMITGITPTLPQNLPSYVSYSVTYADGVEPAQYHLLPKGTKSGNTITPTTEKYKVRIEFLDTITPEQMDAIPEEGLSLDFGYEVQYGQADDNAVEKPLWILPQGKTASTLAVGDEICFSKDNTQCFNFIRYDENNDVVMLAKWNLKVGNIYDSSWNKTGEYTSSVTGYGLQSSEARGYVDGASAYNGTVRFSATNYWMDGNNLKSSYNENDTIYYDSKKYSFKYSSDDSRAFPTIYDETNYKEAPSESNYSVAYYVDGYKTKLTEYGVTIKDTRLLTLNEAINNIGCDASSGSCPTNGFITNTSFWLGSALDSSNVWRVYSDGRFGSISFSSGGVFGVRPVIVVEKSNL